MLTVKHYLPNFNEMMGCTTDKNACTGHIWRCSIDEATFLILLERRHIFKILLYKCVYISQWLKVILLIPLNDNSTFSLTLGSFGSVFKDVVCPQPGTAHLHGIVIYLYTNPLAVRRLNTCEARGSTTIRNERSCLVLEAVICKWLERHFAPWRHFLPWIQNELYLELD